MTVRTTLKAARDLIDDREHWTFGDLAIENTGAPCDPLDSAAYAWCADGALQCAAGGTGAAYKRAAYELNLAARYLFPEINGSSAHVAVNDGEAGIPDRDFGDASEVHDLSHANILRVFDQAIMVAE